MAARPSRAPHLQSNLAAGPSMAPHLQSKRSAPANAAKSKRQKRDQNPSGGVVAAFRDLPGGFDWEDIKRQLQEKLPDDVKVLFVTTNAMDASCCFVAFSAFEEQMTFFEDVTVHVDGLTIVAEVCYGDDLAQALELLPRHIQDKRYKSTRQAQKAKSRPIQLGPDQYCNLGALRGHVKQLMKIYKDGDELNEPHLTTMRNLLEYHPKGQEKYDGLVGIKIDQSVHGDSRSFFIIFESGDVDAYSAKKCLDSMEANPPYI